MNKTITNILNTSVRESLHRSDCKFVEEMVAFHLSQFFEFCKKEKSDGKAKQEGDRKQESDIMNPKPNRNNMQTTAHKRADKDSDSRHNVVIRVVNHSIFTSDKIKNIVCSREVKARPDNTRK